MNTDKSSYESARNQMHLDESSYIESYRRTEHRQELLEWKPTSMPNLQANYCDMRHRKK